MEYLTQADLEFMEYHSPARMLALTREVEALRALELRVRAFFRAPVVMSADVSDYLEDLDALRAER